MRRLHVSGGTSMGAFSRLRARGIRPSTLWVVLVNLLLAVGLALAGYEYHDYNAGRWMRKNEEALEAVGDLKARTLSTWRQERLGDGQMILHNPFLLESLRRCLRGSAPPGVESELRVWMEGLKAAYGYDSILLVRPDGQVAFSLLPRDHAHGADLPLLQEVRARGQVVLSDLYVNDEKSGEIRLALGVPVFLLDGRDRAMGVLLLRLDPALYIYPLLARWPFPSDTAESYLVRHEGDAVVFLSALRHSHAAPLTRRISLQEHGVAAVTAIRGGQGVFHGRDYRGERVLAVARRISDSPWTLMAKIDAEEVERPLEERSWMVAIIVTGMIFTSALVTIFLVRRQRREERRRSAERIMQLNRELESRVQERTAQLERANRELEAFSYSVSHDLRSPLRAIDGFSRVVLEDCGEMVDERSRHYLRRICEAAAKMGELIGALLDLSRVGQADLEIRRVDLSTLAREVLADVRRGQEQREVRLEIEDGVLASTDLQLMHVVLTNLLSNAWKFTRDRVPATITFGTARDHGQAVYFVRDDGAGFDPTYQDRLFLPFQRLHSESEFPGHGVGLTTVQRAIHRLGGKVWAESQVGKGCTVWFTLGGAPEVGREQEPAP